MASAPGAPRAPFAAAPDSAAAALVQGGLWGFGLALVALLLLAPPLAFALLTMLPTAILQAALWLYVLGAAERGVLPAALRLGLTYALPIVAWTLLWSGSEYGSTWPDVLAFLLAVNAPAMLLQIDLLARWRARRCR